MKNQYFADAGDHGKYGFLRYLSTNGISIAVNWYLTVDDGSNDGRHTEYLSKPVEREKDPLLFDFLKQCIADNNRTVKAIERSGYMIRPALWINLQSVSTGTVNTKTTAGSIFISPCVCFGHGRSR